MRAFKETNGAPTARYHGDRRGNAGSPTGREPYGDGAPVVVHGRESRPHGEGGQVSTRDRNGRYARCGQPKRSWPSFATAAGGGCRWTTSTGNCTTRTCT